MSKKSSKPYPGYATYKWNPKIKTLTGPLYYLREAGFYVFSCVALPLVILSFIPFFILISIVKKEEKM